MCIEDYLDGLEVDTLTRTAVLYVESVKNGRRFFEGARRVGRKKPIVLLKGGESQAGKRAAAGQSERGADPVLAEDRKLERREELHVAHQPVTSAPSSFATRP